MAIVKAVKSMLSTLASLKEKINYCRNPHKAGRIDPAVAGISSDPFKAFTVNKFLHGKANRQRLYKEYIISMQAVWPEERSRNQEYQTLMGKLRGSAMRWWEELGFQVYGTIHCNTNHPHIHLVVDTCNARSGKQLSQSPKMLADFKAYLSAAMNDLGLGEGVLGQIEVSEEEMRVEDDSDDYGFMDSEEERDMDYEYFGEDEVMEEDLDVVLEDGDYSDDAGVMNTPPRATYTVSRMLFPLLKEDDRVRYSRELCVIIDNSKGREMCKIIDNSGGRVMCKIADKPNGTVEQRNKDKGGPDEVLSK